MLVEPIMSIPARIHGALQRFRRTETGAVTVDWVVMTGAIVGMGLIVVGTVRMGAWTLAYEVQTVLEEAELIEVDFAEGSDPEPDDDIGGMCVPGPTVPAEQPGCLTDGCDYWCR